MFLLIFFMTFYVIKPQPFTVVANPSRMSPNHTCQSLLLIRRYNISPSHFTRIRVDQCYNYKQIVKCFDDDCYTLFEIFVGNNVHVDEVRQSVILMAAMYAC